MKRHFLRSSLVLFACVSVAALFLSLSSDLVDEMEYHNNYIHSIYSNLNKPSKSHISGLDLSYLPDESMLLPANSSGASIKYYVSGAEEISIQFYSSFGSLAYDGGGEYVLGAERTADIIGGQVYKGESNLFYIDPDGDAFISGGNFFTGEISFPYPYSGDIGEVLKLPILGAGLMAGDGKISARIFPTMLSVSYIDDNSNPDLEGVFFHTVKYIIPSGVSEITIEINDIAGIDDALCLNEPYFTAISMVKFSGEKVAFKKNEVTEPSTESSLPEIKPPVTPPGESSLPPTGESSLQEGSGEVSGNENSGGNNIYFTAGGFFSSDFEKNNSFTYDYGDKFGNAKRQGGSGNLGAKQSGTRVFSIITKVESSAAAIIGGGDKELVTLADIESLANEAPSNDYSLHLIILAFLCATSIVVSFFVSFRSIKKEEKDKK